MLTWSDVKYFKPKDFDSPDAPGSGEKNMSLELVHKIDALRAAVGRPLFITSGYRTPEHHRLIYSGTLHLPNSAHLRGLAVDIRCLDCEIRYLLIKGALALGFTRIEDASAHIHLDIDKSLPQNIILHKKSL